MDPVNLNQGFAHNPKDLFGFEQSERVKTIEQNFLSRSIRVEGKSGAPLQVRPQQSWEVLAVLMSLLSKEGINYTLDKILVQQQGSYVRLNDSDKEAGYSKNLAPISKFEFEKVLAMVHIPHLADEYNNRGGIALNFHHDGLEIAFGMNVDVCQNWSILGGNMIRTYTHQGHAPSNWESNLIGLRGWIRNLNQLWKVETTLMEAMKDTSLPEDKIINNLIGELYERAIRQAYFNGGPTPFDTHQLSLFVQEMIKQRKAEEKLGNVWDLYNWGTSILKPGITNDMAGIQNSVHGYTQYLCGKFGIPIPVVEIID